jgi:hypothetical protein
MNVNSNSCHCSSRRELTYSIDGALEGIIEQTLENNKEQSVYQLYTVGKYKRGKSN